MPFILQLNNSAEFFFASLIVAVLAMVFCYYKAIRKTEVTLLWWLAWLLSLAVAIALQLTVVFHFL